MEMIWESSLNRYSRMDLSHVLITLKKAGITYKVWHIDTIARWKGKREGRRRERREGRRERGRKKEGVGEGRKEGRG